jgi:hypothetical protein
VEDWVHVITTRELPVTDSRPSEPNFSFILTLGLEVVTGVSRIMYVYSGFSTLCPLMLTPFDTKIRLVVWILQSSGDNMSGALIISPSWRVLTSGIPESGSELLSVRFRFQSEATKNTVRERIEWALSTDIESEKKCSVLILALVMCFLVSFSNENEIERVEANIHSAFSITRTLFDSTWHANKSVSECNKGGKYVVGFLTNAL